MILNSPYITGSLTVTGNITASGGITISGSISSASYAANADRVDGLDSTSFVFTSSYVVDSGSMSSRVTTIESKYASTGSNIFQANQTICGNLTTTGTITAQTINVQQVTSSIVYSCGSNIFGCAITDTQQFTGSVFITGSNFSVSSNSACFTGNLRVDRNQPDLQLNILSGSQYARVYFLQDPVLTGGVQLIGTTFTGTRKCRLELFSSNAGISFVTNGQFESPTMFATGSCVGIGTTTPTSSLHIYSAATCASQPQLVISNPTSNTGDAAGIRFNANAGGNTWDVKFQTVRGIDWFQMTNDAGTQVKHSWNDTRYYPGASSSGSARTGYISGDGTNIGIATTSPSYVLDVSGSAMRLKNTGGSADILLDRATTSAGATYQYLTNGTLRWYSGLRGLANDNFYIFNNATSTNTLILDVTSNQATFACRISVGGSMFLGEVQSSYSIIETTAGNGIWLRPAGGTDPTGLKITTSGVVGFSVNPAAQNGGALAGSIEMAGILRIQGATGRYFTTGDGMEISKTSIYSYNRGTSAYNDIGINDAMTVKGAGCVGIGTNSPGAQLDVYTLGGPGTRACDALYLRAGNNSNVFCSNQILFGYNGSTDYAHAIKTRHQSNNACENAIDFFIWNYGDAAATKAGKYVMTIAGNGNVGIGYTSPNYPLQVHSSTSISRIQLTNSSTGTASGDGFQIIADGVNATLSLPETGYMSFETSNAERMRITSGGFTKSSNDGTYYGSTGAYHELRSNDSSNDTVIVSSTNASYAATSLIIRVTRAATSAYNHIVALSNSVEQFKVRGDGVIYAQNTTVQSISDIRTKENITTSTDGLNIINALRPVRFDFKEGFGNDRKNVLGFIAQEVEEIFPDIVDTWKNKPDDEIEYKTLGPAGLIPVLVKAIQEQQCTINTLKTCLGII